MSKRKVSVSVPAPPEPLTADSDSVVTIAVSTGNASGGSSSDGDDSNSLGVRMILHQPRAADAEHGGVLMLATDVLLLSGFSHDATKRPLDRLASLFKQS